MKKFLALFFCLPMFVFGAVTWNLPAEFLLKSSSQNGILPSVAIDKNGNAVSAWINTATGGSGTPTIQASYFSATGSWSSPVFISDGVNPVGIAAPAVAIDNNGNAVVSWFSFVNGYFVVQAAIRPASTGVWTLKPQVSPLNTNAGDVVAAWDASGNAVIGWSVFGGQFQSAAINLLKGVGAVTSVSDSTAVTSSAVMTSNANGDILAAWVNSNSGRVIQSSMRLSGTQAWVGAPLTVSSANGIAQYPAAALDNQRNGVIVWNSASASTTTNVYSSQKSAGGSSWDSPILLSATALNVPNQQVAIVTTPSNQTYMTAAWIESSGQYAAVSSKLFSATSWPAPTNVSGTLLSVGGCLSIGVDSINDIVALWSYAPVNALADCPQNGYPGAIASSSKPFGAAGFTTPIILSDMNGKSPTSCSIAVNVNGYVATTWEIGEGSTTGIQGTTGSFILNPVTNLSGQQQINDFALISEYYNVLNWSPSTSPGVVGYNIYLAGKRIATVSGANTTRYEAHNLKKGQPAAYTVTSVNAQGQESGGVTIRVE
jgi:hypothetical protein